MRIDHIPGANAMKTTLVTFTATCCAALLFGSAQAQNDGARLTDADRTFLQKAAQANMAEVQTGKLAQQKAADGEVRKFGQKMEQDHGKSLKTIQGIARSKGVDLPEAPDEAHQAQADMLRRASGKEFDMMYVKNAGVADHKAAKQLYEQGKKSGDADIKAYATKTLPDIEHHLAMAQKMAEKQ
jgi:putative membrane protein